MKIGVIGGGQLGRMLALAGTPLGMNFAFLDPAPDACAAALGEHLRADYGDQDHLRQLADEVDLVTFEFESVPAETVAFLSQFVPVYPSADALRIARDRWFEKSMFRELGIPTVLVEGQALAHVPIDFSSLDEYLARLSRSRRQNLRRKLKSRAQLQVQRIPTGAAFADDACVDAYYALFDAVYAQSEIHFDRLTRDFFAAVLRDAGNGGLVFEYRALQDDGTPGALLGWNLCFEHGGKLIDKYIGLSYPAAREANLYFVSWMVNLEYAIERGLSHYVAGWTDPEVKAQLGASFTFTQHAVFIRNPLLRALGRRFAGHFESDRQWSEQN